MSFDTALRAVKAAGDPTRLRLLALLAGGEATVGELQEILEQSQPRVSRHLRLLGEAGLVDKFRDGHWVYYRLAQTVSVASLVQQLVDLTGHEDPQLMQDRVALSRVKQSRQKDAYAQHGAEPFMEAVYSGDRPSQSSLLDALDECVGDRYLGDVLDIGSGTGALLCMLGSRARNVVGVDISKGMRMLARSRAHQSGLANCTVRKADVRALPFADNSFDLVVLDEVLGCSDQPSAGLREATRVVKRNGQLIIVDRIQPVARRLSASSGSGVLIENQISTLLSELGYRISDRIWFPGRVMEYALFSALPEISQPRTGTHD
jgi:DNA-binding transcriptional ArsR family regulator/protein-L-isoaspartate O-methyltransferase